MRLFPRQIPSALISAALVCSPVFAYGAENQQAVTLQQLQDVVQKQQELLQQQSVQIRQQSEQIQNLQRQVNELMSQKDSPSKSVAVESHNTQGKTSRPDQPLLVVSGSDKFKLTLSGQINRALNMVADGGSTRLYHVDNNVSNSRIRLVGVSKADGGVTLGTRLELAFTADESSKVSQNQPAPGNYLNARWAEMSLSSDTFGKLSMGKGNTASYTTAGSDLSKTDIVQYSSVADIAGGMLFRARDGQLTGTALSDVFNDYDGLNAKSRLRYDTPTWRGFSLAAALVSDQRSDLGLYWSAEGDGLKAVAGLGFADPHLPGSRQQYDASLSVLHIGSGLNLTLSGGVIERKQGANAASGYVKLGWLSELNRWGSTAFGIDYSRSDNSSASGDRGSSAGVAVVQEVNRFSSELYLQYRVYQLKMGDSTPVHDISVSTLGARVKF